MEFSDERFHRRTIPWAELVREGYNPRVVMLHAQRQGLYRLARSAKHRVDNDKRLKEKSEE